MVLPGNSGGIDLQGSSVMYIPASAQVVAPTPLAMPVTSVPVPSSHVISNTQFSTANTVVRPAPLELDETSNSLPAVRLDLDDSKDIVPQTSHCSLKPASDSVAGTETVGTQLPDSNNAEIPGLTDKTDA